MRWTDWAAEQLDTIRARGQWRTPVARDGLRNFASNDYLGLTQHPAVIAAAHDALDKNGTGAGSARLVVGSRSDHHALEDDLADWKGTNRAVLFSTGYQANLSVLSTLGRAGMRIVSDELNHASIIDGARLAKAEIAVYRHCDVEHAASLVKGAEMAIVVTDSVFSMDGDVAPLADLDALCAATGSLLVVDEAHSVLGPQVQLHSSHLRVGTLSKTLGSLGGFVAGDAAFCDLLVNRARPYIFTTASTPADTAAARAALAVLRSPEGEALVVTLRSHVERVRAAHPSPIIPVVLGDEQAALDAAAFMAENGLLVPAIRPPTVAPGTSRLRVALSAAHTEDEISRLVAALAEL
ncbi:MAG TPA: 8-amino-7-oxononanoate synthase [Acidimicrobiales bacterium]|nr:8-amino-7-oxononanoate synthase [Acidimicrobiales bacterium]